MPINSIIDPPVTPFSPVHEIEDRIKDLKSWEQADDVKQALEEAEEMLQYRKSIKV